MTTVYGVTFIGAKNQIQRQLKDRGDIPAEHLYMCSLYLGRLVLDSIGDIFKGATGIQTWLNRCARLISKSIPPARIEAAMQAEKTNPRTKKRVSAGLSRIPKEQMTSVAWTTPLGLPVVQPYRKAKKRQVSSLHLLHALNRLTRRPTGHDDSTNHLHHRSLCSLRSRPSSSSYRFPSQLHSLSRCYPYDDDCSRLQGT